jgi:hypothetical protein
MVGIARPAIRRILARLATGPVLKARKRGVSAYKNTDRTNGRRFHRKPDKRTRMNTDRISGAECGSPFPPFDEASRASSPRGRAGAPKARLEARWSKRQALAIGALTVEPRARALQVVGIRPVRIRIQELISDTQEPDPCPSDRSATIRVQLRWVGVVVVSSSPRGRDVAISLRFCVVPREGLVD